MIIPKKEKMKVKTDSERLYLRETEDADLALFAEWETRPEVTEFFTISEGRTIGDVAEEVRSRRDDDTSLDLTIVLKETDRPIGRIYISNINEHYDSLDITRIYIGEITDRGCGLGEEALKAALKLGFEVMGCERITLDHFTGNLPAKSLYLKVGFVSEGCMRHGGKKNGEYVDLNLMSMLRSEYFSKKY